MKRRCSRTKEECRPVVDIGMLVAKYCRDCKVILAVDGPTRESQAVLKAVDTKVEVGSSPTPSATGT